MQVRYDEATLFLIWFISICFIFLCIPLYLRGMHCLLLPSLISLVLPRFTPKTVVIFFNYK